VGSRHTLSWWRAGVLVPLELGFNVLLNINVRRAIFLRMAARGKIVDLRKLLTEHFPHTPAPATTRRLITGLSFLDQAIGGGLPKGAITELISPRISAGSASLLHMLLQADSAGSPQPRMLSGVADETPAALTDPHTGRIRPAANKLSVLRPIALIDGRDSFDPSASDGLGNPCLYHLLWVRCIEALDAIKAADLLLRDGNFPLVIVDLVLNPREELRKIPQTSWYRLQRLVEPAPTACLIMTRQGMVSSAQLKIVLENSWTLETFEDESAISQLQIRVQRSQLHRQNAQMGGAS
jgi:hypothetical protein